MPEHHGHHPPPDPNDRYERSDLSIPGIAKGVVIYFIFTGLIGVVVLLGFMGLHQNAEGTVQDTIPPQPYPLLQGQTTATTDIWNLRAREDYLMNNYTYADPNHQYARVPIDTMLDKIAASGPNSIETLPDGYEATPQPPANALQASQQKQAGANTETTPGNPLTPKEQSPNGTIVTPSGSASPNAIKRPTQPGTTAKQPEEGIKP